MKRRTFMGLAASNIVAASIPSYMHASENKTIKSGLTVRFLGTGAADWNGKNKVGELRRFSSVLLDNKVLIDFTSGDKEMLPADFKPDIIFYTHSHFDHYNPEAALKLGIKRVYLSYTWFDIAKADFAKAAKLLNKPMPELFPLYVGQPVPVGDLTFVPLPASHLTDNTFEQTLIYLVEKNDIRLLYATDTAGIPARAARLCGIDSHTKGNALTAIIMEATMGIEHYYDYRIFGHSSVADVERITKVLIKTKRYTPCEGQPVYLTHMSKGLHGTQVELDKNLPKPLKAAYDGLEVTFNSPS